MNCPSCKEGTLLPKKIAEGLPALCCNNCNGLLISMLSYRMWVEDQPEMPDASNEIEPLNESTGALTCPKCHKLMSKFRISGHTANKLDSCGSCGELWADDGEWQLLHILGLTDKVSAILTQPWQHAIKKQESEAAYENRYRELLGNDAYDKVREFRDWMNQQEEKTEIRHYVARRES